MRNELAGRVLAGRYRIGSLLGQGAMAQVVEAFDERLERAVAVKLLRPELSVQPESRARFEQEARAAAGLSHPNVVSVFDTGEDDGRAFLVMERLPGRTLGDRIAEGPLPVDDVVALATDVLGALEAAHRRGLVHRDIKPGNILLTEEGRAKVADFGIAKALPGAAFGFSADLTQVGIVIGTPSYLAPERLAGRPASVPSDLYSVGVMLFEALNGEKPTADGVWRADVPPALAAVVDRARASDPDRRFATASNMARALADPEPQAGATSRVDEATVPVAGTRAMPAGMVPPAPRPRRPSRPSSKVARRRRVALIAAGLGVILLVGIVLAAVDGGGPPTTPAHSPTKQTGIVRSTTTSTSTTTTTTTTTAPPGPPPHHGGPGPGHGNGDNGD